MKMEDQMQELEKINKRGYTPPTAEYYKFGSLSGAFIMGFLAGLRSGMGDQDKPIDKSSLYEWCYLNKTCSKTEEKCEGTGNHDDLFPCSECPHRKEDQNG